MQKILQTLNSIPSLPVIPLDSEERARIQERTAVVPRDKVLCLCPDCVDSSTYLILSPGLISDARDWIKPCTSAAHHQMHLQRLSAQKRAAVFAAPANKRRCLTLDDYSGILSELPGALDRFSADQWPEAWRAELQDLGVDPNDFLREAGVCNMACITSTLLITMFLSLGSEGSSLAHAALLHTAIHISP